MQKLKISSFILLIAFVFFGAYMVNRHIKQSSIKTSVKVLNARAYLVANDGEDTLLVTIFSSNDTSQTFMFFPEDIIEVDREKSLKVQDFYRKKTKIISR